MRGLLSLGLALMVLVLLLAPIARSELVVNEVMSYDPYGFVTLEWIELYNNSDSSVWLGDYRMEVSTNDFDLPHDRGLAPRGYLIICRRLYSEGTTPGIEAFWGDSSGVWGDTPEEDSIPTPHRADFQLKNTGGSVLLIHKDNGLISEFHWSETGSQGVSWERTHPDLDSTDQSVDLTGSTFATVNSVTPLNSDLSIENVEVSFDDPFTDINFTIVNRSIITVSSATLRIHGDGVDDTLNLAPIGAGVSTIVSEQFSFAGLYLDLTASLSADDRDRNNHYPFKAMGSDFPSFHLTEVMANPEDPLETEWVEIINRLDEPYDLVGWVLADLINQKSITEDSLVVDAGERLILADDTSLFHDFYTWSGLLTHEPETFPEFNNSADAVILLDQYGFEADRFEYSDVHDNNHTWCRGETPERENDWGLSENSGGSPGEANSPVFIATGSSLDLEITQRVFDPDKPTSVRVRVPTERATLRIFDREGREVARLLDDEVVRDEWIDWDGGSGHYGLGSRLPIGIYILYLEASNGESLKKTVVIAR